MTVSRRDFLRLRSRGGERVLELSCRMLFMRCSDAAMEPPSPADYEHEQSGGEPPAVLTPRTLDAIFAEIEKDLEGVQTLCLIDHDWLQSLPSGARFQALVDGFRDRGGRVEMVSGSTGR